MAVIANAFVEVALLEDLAQVGALTVQAGGRTLALFKYGEQVYALDNRCPHMGFPLERGTVHDGILTCHWHHARFDLASGGTFDQWADDAAAFPVEIRDGAVWVDVSQHHDVQQRQRERLAVGLERDLPLVIAKAVLALDEGGSLLDAFRAGLDFGARYRAGGWGQGLTMLTCLMNMVPRLRPEDRPRALYHGLSAVTRDTAGSAPRFGVRPLPTRDADIPTLKRWLRQFIEVRDDEGAERCVISAVRAGASPRQMADMLFAAVTDHRYIQIGHPADFTNKAFEALDIAGWDYAERVLPSLVRGYAGAARMEEANEWRSPIDLVALLEAAFAALSDALDAGAGRRWTECEALVNKLLDDDPAASVNALLEALRQGASMTALAGAVTYAAALRIARFHTSNEFGDWDTALHTFTFANAVEQGLKRTLSTELLRGVFDAAASVYLDRFLNIPPARLPQPNGTDDAATLDALADLLDRQQQVNEAGRLVADYLFGDEDDAALLAALGGLLLREDRDFHTIQCAEAAFRQYETLRGSEPGTYTLVAAARYLAAHAPTVRAEGQTYTIARRMHRGEKLFEG